MPTSAKPPLPPADAMQVDYTLTRDELVDAIVHATLEQPATKTSLRVKQWTFAAIFLASAALDYATRQFDPVGPVTFFLLFMGIYYAVFFPGSTRRGTAKACGVMVDAMRAKGALGLSRLIIDADSVTSTGQMTAMTFKWMMIARIERWKGFAIFYASSNQIIVLPSQAFTDTAEFDRFVETAMRYQRATPHPLI